MAVVARVLDQDFVGSGGGHAVVNAVAAALGLAFNAVERVGMDESAGGKWGAVKARE